MGFSLEGRKVNTSVVNDYLDKLQKSWKTQDMDLHDIELETDCGSTCSTKRSPVITPAPIGLTNGTVTNLADIALDLITAPSNLTAAEPQETGSSTPNSTIMLLSFISVVLAIGICIAIIFGVLWRIKMR